MGALSLHIRNIWLTIVIFCNLLSRRYCENNSKVRLGKAHDHDNISICMLKICRSTICKPLAIIFEYCVDAGIFSSEWNKGNTVPIHKKVIDKQWKIIVQYRYSLFTEKFLNDKCLIKCSNSLLKASLSRQTSLVLNQLTLE